MTRRRRILVAIAVPVAVILAYCAFAPLALNGRWDALVRNPNRRYAEFLALRACSATSPFTWSSAARAFREIVQRDRLTLLRAGRADRAAMVSDALAELFGRDGAERVDLRLLPIGGFRRRLADFARAHGGSCRVWCAGLRDLVFTAGPVRTDALLEAYSDPKAFARYVAADVTSPVDLMACYVGSSEDLADALAPFGERGRLWTWAMGPRVAFDPPPRGDCARVDVAALTPVDVQDFGWIARGAADESVHAAFTNRAYAVQVARREALRGFAARAAGDATNAVAHWAAAARMNKSDPLLANLGDMLDLEGRERLAMGDVNGAVRCYENRLDVFPDDVSSVHNFGVCLKRGGRPELAAQVFMKLARRNPAEEAHLLEFVECAAAAGHEEDAIAALGILRKAHPEDVELKRREMRLRAYLARKNVREFVK